MADPTGTIAGIIRIATAGPTTGVVVKALVGRVHVLPGATVINETRPQKVDAQGNLVFTSNGDPVYVGDQYQPGSFLQYETYITGLVTYPDGSNPQVDASTAKKMLVAPTATATGLVGNNLAIAGTVLIGCSAQAVMGSGGNDIIGNVYIDVGTTTVVGNPVNGSTDQYPAYAVNVNFLSWIGNFYNNAGPLVASISITGTAVGQFGVTDAGVMLGLVKMTSQIAGLITPFGTINDQIPITAAAVGEADAVNSIYGSVNVGITARGYCGTVNGGIVGSVIINGALRSGTASVYGRITDPITIKGNGHGIAYPTGTIAKTDQQFTTNVRNGAVYPDDFAFAGLYVANIGPSWFMTASIKGSIVAGDGISKFGAIDHAPIPITPSITGLVAGGGVAGSIDSAQVIISTDPVITRGIAAGNSGTIAAQITIVGSAISGDIGEKIAKANASIVTMLDPLGVKLFKATTQVITMTPPSVESIAKAVAYAVLAPAATEVVEQAYQVIFFN